MKDKKKDAKPAKTSPQADLRDLELLDSKTKKVKGGGMRKRAAPRKRKEQ